MDQHEVSLTPMEKKVLEQLLKKKLIKQSYHALSISRTTFSYHVRNIRRKFQNKSVLQIVYELGKKGLL